MSTPTNNISQNSGSEYIASEWPSRADYDAWLLDADLSDTASQAFVDRHVDAGVNVTNLTELYRPIGDPYAPVAFIGTYKLEDIKMFYARMDHALKLADFNVAQLRTFQGEIEMAMIPMKWIDIQDRNDLLPVLLIREEADKQSGEHAADKAQEHLGSLRHCK